MCAKYQQLTIKMNASAVIQVAKKSPPLSLCKESHWIQKAKSSFFLWCFMQMCLIFMLIKLSEGSMSPASCSGVQPHPAWSQIHSFIFWWQTEHYFCDSQICWNTWNQPSCLFKTWNLQEVGPRNLFTKIFPGDS